MDATLARITIELRFKERMNLLTGHARLQTRLSGKSPQDMKTWLMPGLRNEDSEKREIFVINAERTMVELYSPRTPEQAIDRALQIFTVVDEEFTLPEVLRWGFRSIWMFDQDDEYDDLLEKWRKRFFAPEAIVRQATDVGISLDFSDEETGLTIRMSGGPTYEKQIRETWMTLGEDPLPATANLMDTDIGFTDEPMFSRRTLSNYAKLAIRKTKEYADKVNSVIEGNG